MAKDNLETRANKSIIKIEKSVNQIYNVLTDFNLKLCHIIENFRDDYRNSFPNSYYSDF